MMIKGYDALIMQTASNIRSAVEFFELIVAGKIDEAYEKYVNMRGKHHNPFYPAGFAALKKGMEENQARFPNKRMTIAHAFGEGDLVAIHVHVVLEAEKTEVAVMHIVRFEDSKIVELWDCGQPVEADSLNEDGMF
jgi:predicted SnoaL-like aldol condensation-catalyzing enzyme